MNRRGVTPVVGFVILVGIAAIGAMSLFVAGLALADATQSDAEQQQLKGSMTEFADSASEIAAGENDFAEYKITGADHATASIDEDAGHIKMWVETGSGTADLLNDSLGAYEYETADGQQVTFQGGGVWSGASDGNSNMIRPPEFEYRNDPDPTLTYKHMKVTGNPSHNGDNSGTMSITTQEDLYPSSGQPNPLKNGSVYVQIQSGYCDGWEDFYEQRTPSAVIDECGSSDEVTVKFSVPFEFDGVGNHEYTTGSLTDTAEKHTQISNMKANGKLNENSDLDAPLPDSLIESKVEECETGECEPLSGEMTGGNTYYTDEVDGGTLEFNTSDGDIELVVDGPFEPDNFQGADEDGNVTVFANGPVLHQPFKDLTLNKDAAEFRFLIHSDYDFGSPGAGDGTLHAFIYAPGSTVSFPNMDFHGGVVSEEIDLQSPGGGATNVNARPSVKDIELNYDQGGEPFYYLHVSETELNIED